MAITPEDAWITSVSVGIVIGAPSRPGLPGEGHPETLEGQRLPALRDHARAHERSEDRPGAGDAHAYQERPIVEEGVVLRGAARERHAHIQGRVGAGDRSPGRVSGNVSGRGIACFRDAGERDRLRCRARVGSVPY